MKGETGVNRLQNKNNKQKREAKHIKTDDNKQAKSKHANQKQKENKKKSLWLSLPFLQRNPREHWEWLLHFSVLRFQALSATLGSHSRAPPRSKKSSEYLDIFFQRKKKKLMEASRLVLLLFRLPFTPFLFGTYFPLRHKQEKSFHPFLPFLLFVISPSSIAYTLCIHCLRTYLLPISCLLYATASQIRLL